MKWLKKVRLINWHYFQDETIEFGKQNALVGGSGAGKSTIIDALQVIFIANHVQIKFNSAAHDETKRSMANYLRGKIGTDQKSFMREDDFTTYILSEFWDDKKKKSFVVGAVIDVFKDSVNDSEEFFILANKTIDDIDVIASSGHLRNIVEFKRQFPTNRQQSLFEKNKSNYQKALLNRFGQVSPRFFSTFLKALSFKPIQNVRGFVYDYILDEKELQLDVLKDNFETYERMKLELENLDEKKEKLTGIAQTYNQFERLSATVIEQEYVLMKLEKLYNEEILSQLQQSFDSKNEDIRILEGNSAQTLADKDEAEKKKNHFLVQYHENKNQIKKKELEKKIRELRLDKENGERRMDLLAHEFRCENSLLGEIVDWSGNHIWFIPKDIANPLRDNKTVLARLSNIFRDRESISESERIVYREELSTVEHSINQLSTALITYSGKTQDEVKAAEQRIKETQDFIQKLEQKKLTYPAGVERLKKRLEDNFGDEVPVHIFCEEMEVVDDRWRNAIEGYLNTQRFDLLVEAHYFQDALAIYEKDKFQYKIEGVGLVDTDKQEKLRIEVKEHSLASSLQTENNLIQMHINYLLGNVMKAEDEKQLRTHKTAITSTCMVYNRLTARQMPAERYAIPFIGSHAIVKQLEMKKQELEQAFAELKAFSAALMDFDALREKIGNFQIKYDNYIKNLIFPSKYAEICEQLTDAEKEYSELDLSEVELLFQEYEKWERNEKELAGQWHGYGIEIAKLEEALKYSAGELHKTKNEIRDWDSKIEVWESGIGLLFIQGAQKRWKDVEKQITDTYKKLTDLKSSHKGMQSRKEDKWKELVDLRRDYNRLNDLNENPQTEKNDAYQKELSKIENVNIPHYQERLETSLQNAENEFKAHFVYKLKEAIQNAKSEFESLDYALKNLPFSKERYKFEVKPSAKYKHFYDVIMDPILMEKGLFADIEDDERNRVLQELFEILATENVQELEGFTDYRQYLDFDIRITFEDGSTQSLSKLLREKSGGETQTPFYIAILASFHHLYKGTNTVRLVVFDEAFSKMDEKNIKSSLRLVKKLDLQLIAAVPDEKMPQMFPEVTTTLIVTNQNHRCYVDMLDRNEELDISQEVTIEGEQTVLF